MDLLKTPRIYLSIQLFNFKSSAHFFAEIKKSAVDATLTKIIIDMAHRKRFGRIPTWLPTKHLSSAEFV
jgi:hypothetical protein